MKKQNILPNGNSPIQNIKQIGQIIRQKRKQWKMTQIDAAGLCHVGIRFLSELENGKSTLEISKVLKVIQAFGFELHLQSKERE